MFFPNNSKIFQIYTICNKDSKVLVAIFKWTEILADSSSAQLRKLWSVHNAIRVWCVRFRFLLILSDEVSDMQLQVLPLLPLRDEPDAICRLFLFSLPKVASSNPRNMECLQYIEYHDSNISPYHTDKSDVRLMQTSWSALLFDSS